MREVEGGREEDDEHFAPREARVNLGQEVLPVVARRDAEAGRACDARIVQRMRDGRCLEHCLLRTWLGQGLGLGLGLGLGFGLGLGLGLGLAAPRASVPLRVPVAYEMQTWGYLVRVGVRG